MIASPSLDLRLPQRDRLILLVLVIAFVIILVLGSMRITLTIDESLHYHSFVIGCAIVDGSGKSGGNR